MMVPMSPNDEDRTGLTGQTQWKEELTVSDEQGRSFTFYCGWGVEPPHAYIPAAADWARCVPGWLHERRDEVIALMRRMGHIVDEGHYPDLVGGH